MEGWLRVQCNPLRGRDCPFGVSRRGVTLVELLVVTALIGLVFFGLVAAVQTMLQLSATTRAEAGAVALAIDQLEYIRSLDYFSAGTVGGVVAGPVAQTATTSLNGIEYTRSVSIQYYDRPDDGLVTDSTPDPVPQDSKRVVVTVSWQVGGTPKEIKLQTDIIPPGLESVNGGGTIIVNVFDANVQPVAGADVRVVNNSLTPTIDEPYVTDTAGRAVIPGVPAGANYELFATKAGYSTDQTYVASGTNPVPVRTPIAVASGSVSTINFQIDELSGLTVETIGPPVKTIYPTDTFDSAVQVERSADVDIGGGEVVLAGGAGSYVASGYLFASTSEPTTLASWESFDFDATTTAASTLTVHLYSVVGVGSTSVHTLIPDTDLPGNAAGFTAGPVNITSVPTSFGRLALGASLTSTDPTQTPRLFNWSLTHIESESAVPNVPFTLTGDKTIGTNGGQPVYKYSASHTTDGSGQVLVPDLEFDGYRFDLDTSSYTIAEVIGGDPFEKRAGVDEAVTLVLESPSAHSLRATVNTIYNDPIAGASVQLTDLSGPYDTTQETSIYGQTYFSSGVSSSTYELQVTAPGYDDYLVPSLAINGNVEIAVQLVVAGSGGGTPPGGGSTTTATSTYLAGYDTRVPLSIDGSALYGTVVDYPVYVDLGDLPAAFFSSVQAGGADIRVTEDDGLTEVPVEVVGINTGAQTGELYFKAPSLSISETSTFYVYFGSSTATLPPATDTNGRNNVWSNSFLAVYHFDNDGLAGTGHAGVYVDATGNGYDGNDYVQTTGTGGLFGAGQSFARSNLDYITLPHTLLNGRTNLTVSKWYRTTGSSNPHPFLSAANSGDPNEFLDWILDSDSYELWNHDNRAEWALGYNINDGAWRYYVWVRDDTNNQVRAYLNLTTAVGSRTLTALSVASGGLLIGQDQDSVGGGFDSNQELDGDLDELRISSIVRPAAWLNNEHLNHNTPTGFYSVGTIETE